MILLSNQPIIPNTLKCIPLHALRNKYTGYTYLILFYKNNPKSNKKRPPHLQWSFQTIVSMSLILSAHS